VRRKSPFLFLVLLVVATCGPTGTVPASAGRSPDAAETSFPSFGPTTAASSPTFSAAEPAAEARRYIDGLTAIGPRVAGSDAESAAAAYIATALKSAGYDPRTIAFTATGWDRRRINSANVVAVKAGTSPRQIVVGAHYDSVARGLGADDNASGVAVMLELAEALVSKPTPYTIRFVAFGAEEVGSLGSKAFVAAMSEEDRANTVLMVNLDSVVGGDYQYLYGQEDTSAARDWGLAWASANGLDLRTVHDVEFIDERGNGFSDYWPFLLAGIPFVYLEATDWTLGDKNGWTQVDTSLADRGVIRHTAFDTLAWLDAAFPGRVDSRLSLSLAVLFALLTEYQA
jgi:hypothetical protein